MNVLLCSLALLSFLIFSTEKHHAYPYSNVSQIQLLRSTSGTFMTYFDLFAFTKKITSPAQNKTLTDDSFIEKSTTSTRHNTSLIYDLSIEKSTTPAPTSISQSKPLVYDTFTDKFTASTSTSTSRSKSYTRNPYTEKSTDKEIMLTYDSLIWKTTTFAPVFQPYRNRYNFRHRFRNQIITIVSPLSTTTSRQTSRRIAKEEKAVPWHQIDNIFKDMKKFAFIDMAKNSTPMVHLNITIPRDILEGKIPRLASPYIIRITLPRKLAPKSNTTLPNRGFLRIVGSPVNMIQNGEMGYILGKIANQIGKAYNMSGKDVQKMGRMIILGPGGQRINRRATPPKKTTVLTSPMVMTARLRLRLNCTLPKVTNQVIYFEDYIKYFELY